MTLLPSPRQVLPARGIWWEKWVPNVLLHSFIPQGNSVITLNLPREIEGFPGTESVSALALYIQFLTQRLTLINSNYNCLDVSVWPGSPSNSHCRKNHSHALPVLPQLTSRQECPWLSYYFEDVPATISACHSPGKEAPTTQVGSSSADFLSCVGRYEVWTGSPLLFLNQLWSWRWERVIDPVP